MTLYIYSKHTLRLLLSRMHKTHIHTNAKFIKFIFILSVFMCVVCQVEVYTAQVHLYSELTTVTQA